MKASVLFLIRKPCRRRHNCHSVLFILKMASVKEIKTSWRHSRHFDNSIKEYNPEIYVLYVRITDKIKFLKY